MGLYSNGCVLWFADPEDEDDKEHENWIKFGVQEWLSFFRYPHSNTLLLLTVVHNKLLLKKILKRGDW